MALPSRRAPEMGGHAQALGPVLQGLDRDSCNDEVGKRVEDRETFQNAPAHPKGQSFPTMVGAAFPMKTVLTPNVVSAPMV